MDPLTIAVAAATVVLTKMLEKTGETMGDKAMEAGGNLLNLLRRKSPNTVAKLEQATAQKTLSGTPDIIDAEILEEVKQLAEQDAEIMTGVDAAATANPKVKADIEAAVKAGGGVVNMTQLAEKIGFVNQGTIARQENTFNL